MRLACSAAGYCLLLAVATAVAQDESPPAGLPGYWKLESIEVAGQAVELPADPVAWHIHGNKVSFGGQEFAAITVDDAGDPKAIDLAMHSGQKMYEGAFEVDRDRLRICFNIATDGVKERPTSLQTKDHPTYRLLSFKRIAAGDVPPPKGYVGMALRLDEDRREVVIANVLPDSPALQAGLKEEDVLLKVGGIEVNELLAAVATVRQLKPGSRLRLDIRRDGQAKQFEVTVGAFPFHLLGVLD